MTCIWNGNLHGWRVDRSNKYHQKQFPNLDHCIQNPKSREHNEHTWFVIRLRIGPATEPLKKLTDLKLKANRHVEPTIQTCALPDWHSRNERHFTFEELHVQKAHATTSKDTHQWLTSTSSNPSSTNQNPFHANTFRSPYIPRNYQSKTIQWSYSSFIYISKLAQWMPHNVGLLLVNTPYGMPQLQHYSSGWQTSSHILQNTVDQVHEAFFYGDYTQQMWSLPKQTLLGHFKPTLNNAFEAKLAHKDKGYEGGSESFNIPTPLSWAPRIYYVSTMEELSLKPTNISQSPTPPEHYEGHSSCGFSCHSFTHYCLVFPSSDDETQWMTPPTLQHQY